MNPARICELLAPFLPAPLTASQLDQISIYIDLLLRWNSRINLTAIRDPEQIVTRHFGESVFSARYLLPNPDVAPDVLPGVNPAVPPARAVDLGSGAGFPGLPLKICSPQTSTTLIESNHKKVAFLREVIRSLTLTSIDVFPGHAQDFPSGSAGIVTVRAVERFTSILPIATRLLAPGGRLALLIGSSQVPEARATVPELSWTAAVPIPRSEARVLFVGARTDSVTGT